MSSAEADKRRARVTIRDVAEDAGVSTSAVSKVLRDAYGVSDALRVKVESSMRRLGYRPLAAARGMRGQTYTLGLVLPDLRNPFFADLMTGVNNALERTQYRTLIGIGHSTGVVDTGVVDAMMDRQMDGLILVGPTESRQTLDKMADARPLVLIGQHDLGARTFDTVNNNDRLGGLLATRHLLAQGFADVAMISLSSPSSSIIGERELGYRQAMLEADMEHHIRVVHAPQVLREVQIVARRLLSGPNRPDAVFCWTDFIALEVISLATEMGLRIPEDLAIVGYDNTMYCDFAQNSLSSIDQSGELLGLQAARLLVERIKGRSEPEHFVVTPRLVARRSSSLDRRP